MFPLVHFCLETIPSIGTLFLWPIGRVGALEVLGQEVHPEGSDGHSLGGRRKSGRHDRLVSFIRSLRRTHGMACWKVQNQQRLHT